MHALLRMCCHLVCTALQVRCPVKINTGTFTKQLRTAAIEGGDAGAGAASASTTSGWGSRLAMYGASHFRLISRGAPLLLNTVDAFHGCVSVCVLATWLRCMCVRACMCWHASQLPACMA
jgi:hypothetical protein